MKLFYQKRYSSCLGKEFIIFIQVVRGPLAFHMHISKVLNMHDEDQSSLEYGPLDPGLTVVLVPITALTIQKSLLL